MKWRECLRGHVLAGASAAIFFFGPLVVLGLGWNVQTAIYWVTGLVVLHYTYETYRMRNEMVRQNQLAVQPLILATVERVEISMGTSDLRVVLRNIGRGPALFARVDDFNTHDDDGEMRSSLRIPPVDCIESGAQSAQDVESITRGRDGIENSHT